MDDDILVCRGQRHEWPVVTPGRPLPRGVKAQPAREGAYRITETCLRCGQVDRTITTEPHGFWPRARTYSYSYGDRWEPMPEFAALGPRDMKGEAFRRAVWEGGSK